MSITLKAARVNKGLTQAEAGKILGVTADVISNWERGITFPNVVMLGKIEKEYGIPYNKLIFLPEKSG